MTKNIVTVILTTFEFCHKDQLDQSSAAHLSSP